MPLWFDVTAVIVVGVAMLGLVTGYVGILTGRDRIAYAGGFFTFVPAVGFILMALVCALILALGGNL